MLKLQDGYTGTSTAPSAVFISNHSEPINVLAVDTDGNGWGAGAASVLTVEINPDPKREEWNTLYQGGVAVALEATNNMAALTLPGGVYCRFVGNDTANTDLNLWVGGPGVTLVSGEV